MTPEHVKKAVLNWCKDIDLQQVTMFGVPITEIDDADTLRRCILICMEQIKQKEESHKQDQGMRDAFTEFWRRRAKL